MTGKTLDLRRLVRRHPGADEPALAGIDLRVEAGRILVLLGPSGAGKTTLLRIVAGLEVADAGEVWIGDQCASDPRILIPPQRRRIGLVFQHLELWPHMTVAENVAFGLPGRPTRRAALADVRVQEIAARVGIEGLLRRVPGTLSGGERQRVAIARTLAPRPSVVLYDEPLANLDPARRSDLRRLIRGLCREEDTTLLYVTHDAEEAMAVGDEIAVLARGRVVDRGPPEALYRHPTTLAGARALGPVTVLPAEVEDGVARTALGRIPYEGTTPPGRAVLVMRPEAIHVRTSEAGEGEVEECRPLGPVWRVRARMADHTIEGASTDALPPGAHVAFEVAGPATLVEQEEAA